MKQYVWGSSPEARERWRLRKIEGEYHQKKIAQQKADCEWYIRQFSSRIKMQPISGGAERDWLLDTLSKSKYQLWQIRNQLRMICLAYGLEYTLDLPA